MKKVNVKGDEIIIRNEKWYAYIKDNSAIIEK
jgi:hypothetical protein